MIIWSRTTLAEVKIEPQSVPQSINDLFNIFGKVKNSVDLYPATSSIGNPIPNPTDLKKGNILDDIKNGWNKVNDWFEKKIGTSLRAVIIAIGNFVAWAFDAIANLIRLGISHL